MMKVEIISQENIKPSSPTPQHLRTFSLSVLDQLIPVPYLPIILYFPNHDGATNLEVRERSEMLKQSLSETLTRFYPLAGSIKDHLSIDCNDIGAYYAVAQVSTRLTEFLNEPHLELINHFLPCEPSFSESSPGTRVTNVQLNFFECGGIAIGLSVSHKILDGAALRTFLRGWAGSTCGEKGVMYPNLNLSSLFPATDSWLRDASMARWGSLFKKGRCSTRRFVFDASTIATLKAEAAGGGVQHPSRVEVVSAFIWKSAMAASRDNCGYQKPSVLSHLVNLRKRLPSVSESSIGNLIWLASAECETQSDTLVTRVQESISKIDSDFVKKLQGVNGKDAMGESLKSIKRCQDYFGFTSWCKMGFYEVDFGWGKPIWVSGSVCDGSPVFMNFVVLMDTRYGDGIEAWVNIDEREMDILRRNQELLAFATLDPSPL